MTTTTLFIPAAAGSMLATYDYDDDSHELRPLLGWTFDPTHDFDSTGEITSGHPVVLNDIRPLVITDKPDAWKMVGASDVDYFNVEEWAEIEGECYQARVDYCRADLAKQIAKGPVDLRVNSPRWFAALELVGEGVAELSTTYQYGWQRLKAVTATA